MFWSIFEKMCAQQGETPNGVAKKMGLSNATTTKWKNGSTPSGKTLQMLADYFHCSVDYLLGKANVVSPQSTEQSPDDNEFLDLFRNMSQEDRLEIVRLMLEKKNKK
ncbi:MAG: helix-turn-helix transcriptional regulator [Clostridia bacterium]|nr:helix-turn-helix transcriptional regulator [Clostridia bacterium]